MKVRFLSLAEGIQIHRDQVERYGGEPTLRDRAMLESAVAMPAAAFGGDYLHAFPHEMAAVYLFHLVKNHPFVDGNKRVGLASALVFLKLNGVNYRFDKQELEKLVLSVARGESEKAEVVLFFRQHIHWEQS